MKVKRGGLPNLVLFAGRTIGSWMYLEVKVLRFRRFTDGLAAGLRRPRASLSGSPFLACHVHKGTSSDHDHRGKGH